MREFDRSRKFYPEMGLTTRSYDLIFTTETITNMKYLKTILALLATAITTMACNNDDEKTIAVSTSVKLNKDLVSISVGEYDFVIAIASPDANKKVVWTSDNVAIATVDNGKITGVAEGKTKVTALCDNAEASCWVVVSAKEESDNNAYSVSLNETEIALEIDKAFLLEASIIPNDKNVEIKWSSDNESIASVSNGKVTALSEGEATISASVGSNTASCKVLVNAKPQQKEYRLVWSDEFDGNTLNTENWNIEKGGGGWGNQELQYYTDRQENLTVADGKLIITVRKEEYENRNYTSARITTKNKRDFTYGKIEARIKLPKGGGTWPAFWMLGYGSWPYCGEIDIMEHVGNNPDMTSFALHTNAANGSKGNNWHSQPTTVGIEDDFHIFGVEWVCNEQLGRDIIYFSIDGERMASKMQPTNVLDKAQWPFYNPFYIILNVAMGGTMGGKINDAIFEQETPVQMLVDWVRVYQY